jgi:hypothetical protein
VLLLSRAFTGRCVPAHRELRGPPCSCLPSASPVTMLLLIESICRLSCCWSSRASLGAVLLAEARRQPLCSYSLRGFAKEHRESKHEQDLFLDKYYHTLEKKKYMWSYLSPNKIYSNN